MREGRGPAFAAFPLAQSNWSRNRLSRRGRHCDGGWRSCLRGYYYPQPVRRTIQKPMGFAAYAFDEATERFRVHAVCTDDVNRTATGEDRKVVACLAVRVASDRDAPRPRRLVVSCVLQVRAAGFGRDPCQPSSSSAPHRPNAVLMRVMSRERKSAGRSVISSTELSS